MLVAVGMAAGGEQGGGSGPSASPSSVSVYPYGETPLYGVQWTNGDSTASTDIGFSSTAGGAVSLFARVGPGVASYETADPTPVYWWARHFKNGTGTSWVAAS